MRGIILAMIDPADVAARHYFLEQLHAPYVIWGIRALFAAGAAAALIVYWKMRHGGE